MTYLALAAGYRGIGFRATPTDAASDGPGRALWIEMASSISKSTCASRSSLRTNRRFRDYGVFDPEPLPVPTNATQLPTRRPPQVKELSPASGHAGRGVPLGDRKGALLLVGDFAAGSQFQPPPARRRRGHGHAWLCPRELRPSKSLPARSRYSQRERVADGTRITLKEFDTTSLILCTSDLALYDQVRPVVEGIRPEAVSLAIEQSEILLQAVTETNGRLAADGHRVPQQGRPQASPPGWHRGAPPDVPDLLARSQEADQRRPRGHGAARLRRGLGRGRRAAPAPHRDERPLAAGSGRPHAGRQEVLSPARG